MQLPIKVNADVMVQPCTPLVLRGTSQNEIQTKRPVVQHCWYLARMRQLSANTSWDYNLHGNNTTALVCS